MTFYCFIPTSKYLKTYLSLIAFIPGNSLPSKYSNDAPPPVEMCVKSSSKPNEIAAAAESPPPIIVVASYNLAIDSHTPIVPLAKLLNSNTPIGPFHTTVCAPCNSLLNNSTVLGPISIAS